MRQLGDKKKLFPGKYEVGKLSTIKDVAKAAQVSVSTASRALNDNPRISDATIAKVKAVAKQLNYQPNSSAKALSKGEVNVVGVVFPVTNETAPANPFQLDIIRGANTELVAKNYVLATAICQGKASLLKNVKAMVEQSKVHNFLVLYAEEKDPVADYLRETGQNFVVVGQPAQTTDRYINNDNVLAGRKVTSYILERKQATTPILVRSAENWQYEQDREVGYQAEMLVNGGTPLIYELGKTDPKAFFNEHPTVDAIISVDDINLLRFYNQLKAIKWPTKLPAICFNRSRLLSLASPTAIKVDMMPRQLGAKAVQLLFNRKIQRQLVGFKIID